MLLPRFIFALVLLLFPLSQIVLWRIHPVDRALVPDGIASALVAVHPLLLATFVAVDGSEARFNLQLFLLGF